MLKKGGCPNRGCYYSKDPYEDQLCIECTLRYSDNLDDNDVYEVYYASVEEFKNNNYFRTQIREVDGNMTGDYEGDLEIFDSKLFDIINTILLVRQTV